MNAWPNPMTPTRRLTFGIPRARHLVTAYLLLLAGFLALVALG